MSFTFTTSAAIIAKAGAGASPDVTASGALLLQYSDEAERYINVATKYNWIDAYADLPSHTQLFFSDLASNIAAQKVITYDLSGYFSRLEAQTILDFLDDQINKAIALLKDPDVNVFVRSA